MFTLITVLTLIYDILYRFTKGCGTKHGGTNHCVTKGHRQVQAHPWKWTRSFETTRRAPHGWKAHFHCSKFGWCLCCVRQPCPMMNKLTNSAFLDWTCAWICHDVLGQRYASLIFQKEKVQIQTLSFIFKKSHVSNSLMWIQTMSFISQDEAWPDRSSHAPLPANPGCQLGDLYRIGCDRIIHMYAHDC